MARSGLMVLLAGSLVGLAALASTLGNSPVARLDYVQDDSGMGRPLPKDGETRKGENPIPVALNVVVELSATFHVAEGELPVVAFECGSKCLGKKHAKHTDCDASCDEKCKGEYHWNTIEPTYAPATPKPGEKSNEDVLKAAYTKFGLPGSVTPYDFLNKAELFASGHGSQTLINVPYYRVPNTPHWNTTPCSNSAFIVKMRKYQVDLQFVIVDLGDSGKERNEGPKGTLKFEVFVAIPGSGTTTQPVVYCKCEQTQTAPAEPLPGHGFLPGRTPTGQGSGTETGYAWVEENGKRRPLTGSDVGHLVNTVSVPNMNAAFFELNPAPWGAGLIPAGWELECIDGSGQNVQLQEDLAIQVVEPGLVIEWPATQGKRIRALCLEMHKPEPREGMKYRLSPPQNPALARLAQISKNSRIRGAWDQARLWIATDKASYDEMAKVLIPMPGMATYLRQMWLAAGVGAISTEDPKIQAIMENRLMLAEFSDPEAVDWFIGEKLRRNASGVAQWIQTQKDVIAGLFGQGDVADDIELLSTIASALAVKGGPEGIRSAAWLFTEGVPAPHRAAMNASPAAHHLAMMLVQTEDEKAAAAILDWLASAKPTAYRYVCRNVNPKLPDSVKDRAAKIAETPPTR